MKIILLMNILHFINCITNIMLGSPRGICHSHTSAWNWGGFSNYFITEHSNLVTTTCFFHVGGFFTGVNACRKHSSYYHVSIHFNPF